ncbi:MAG: rod shape-determining protein MreD [candidate division Zixibacteria bacterium]|nr:rod shape-determining protein MreD [candidate division Zixibacteria bacterium]
MAIRLLIFLVYAYLTAFCQTLLANIMAIHGIAPDFTMIIILIVVLREEFDTAYPIALIIALIADALTPEFFGYGAFVRFGLAAVIYELRQHLNLEPWYSRLYVLIGAEVVFQLGYQLIAGGFDFGAATQVYWESSLPTLAYTAVVGFVVFYILDLDIRLDIRRRRLD